MKTKTTEQDQEIITVKLADLTLNQKNPRKDVLDRYELDKLKENMKALGQLTPLKIDENNMILAGHRRYQVAKELGWESLKCIVQPGLTEFQKSCVLFSDNTLRSDFDAWEYREAVNKIYWDEFCETYTFKSENDKGFTEFAKLMGISPEMVKRIIESMTEKNQILLKRLRKNDVRVRLVHVILSAPPKIRDEFADIVIDLEKHKEEYHKQNAEKIIEVAMIKLKDLKMENNLLINVESVLGSAIRKLKIGCKSVTPALLKRLDKAQSKKLLVELRPLAELYLQLKTKTKEE